MRDIEYSKLTSIDSEEFERDISLEPMVKPIRLRLHAAGSHSEIEILQTYQVEKIKTIARRQGKRNNSIDDSVLNKKSIVQEIKGLKELLDSGVITQAEFDATKKKLIADM
jgi:hypothetical protein